MAGSLSDEVRDTAARAAALPESDFLPALTGALASLFPGFSVGTAAIRDSAGTQTPPFEVVVSVGTIANGIVDADSVACVICVYFALDDANLHGAYDRIAQAKSLIKTPVEKDRSSITMGAVVAAKSAFSLGDLAQIVPKLNATVPERRYPDLICVLSKGVIGYGVQFPGDQGSSWWLPPAEAERDFVAPVYLFLQTVATSAFSLNQLVVYIIGQLGVFAPKSNLPDKQEIEKDIPRQRTIIAAFQFDTTHKLVEVAGRQVPLHPYVIDDPKRNRLLKLAFIPWQDGGVIIAEGKLPLNGLLVLAGRPLPMVTHNTLTGRQLSSVLPIDAAGFIDVMTSIARRMRRTVVRKSTQEFTIVPLLDEGTSSPFGARILMTLPMLRDQALHDKAQVAMFDELFQFTMTNLIDLRKAYRELLDLWSAHEQRVESGQAVRYTNAFHVTESIDQPLGRIIGTLVMSSARVAKKMQHVTDIFGIDIGFLFQNAKEYAKGLPKLAASDPELTTYVSESRAWLEPLREWRIAMEHRNYVPPKMQYERDANGKVHLLEPEAIGLPLRAYFGTMLSHLYRFVEEVIVWCVQRSLPDPMIVTEIPVGQRDPNKVERFKVTLKGHGNPWAISHSDDDFDKV